MAAKKSLDAILKKIGYGMTSIDQAHGVMPVKEHDQEHVARTFLTHFAEKKCHASLTIHDCPFSPERPEDGRVASYTVVRDNKPRNDFYRYCVLLEGGVTATVYNTDRPKSTTRITSKVATLSIR